MLFRSTVEGDLDRLTECVVREPVGSVTAEQYRAELAQRQYRHEWTWVAEDGGRILARGLWWGRPDADHPYTLDCLYVDPSVRDPAALAGSLLTAALDDFAYHGAPEPPTFDLNLPSDWHDDPAVAAAVGWRRAAARTAGLTDELERLRFTWTPDAGVPATSGRLVFTPEPDADAFVDVFVRVSAGSLDGTTRRNVEAHGARWAAEHDYALYAGMPGDRSWWRVAHTTDGRLAGFTIPTHNPYGPVVGYLGVVPELRGHGYIDDLLTETTRVHADAGAKTIRAMTDVGNRPMAAAFRRGGYRDTAVRVVLSAPPR